MLQLIWPSIQMIKDSVTEAVSLSHLCVHRSNNPFSLFSRHGQPFGAFGLPWFFTFFLTWAQPFLAVDLKWETHSFLLLKCLGAIVGYSLSQFQYYNMWGNKEASLEAERRDMANTDICPFHTWAYVSMVSGSPQVITNNVKYYWPQDTEQRTSCKY